MSQCHILSDIPVITRVAKVGIFLLAEALAEAAKFYQAETAKFYLAETAKFYFPWENMA